MHNRRSNISLRQDHPMTFIKRVFNAYVNAAGSYPMPMIWAF